MKCWLLYLALPLFAQFSDGERALGAKLREEILREAKPVSNPAFQRYIRELKLDVQVDLVEIDAADPIGLPGGYVLVPVGTLRDAQSEAKFLLKLMHAVGHVVLKHGVEKPRPEATAIIYMGGWSGVHPDPKRTSTMPAGFRKEQPRWEKEAEDYAEVWVGLRGLGPRDPNDFKDAQDRVR